MRKYEILKSNSIVNAYGIKLYQIRALCDGVHFKKGDLGGYVQHKNNLSQHECGWIGEGIEIFGDVRLYDEAFIYGKGCIVGNKTISLVGVPIKLHYNDISKQYINIINKELEYYDYLSYLSNKDKDFLRQERKNLNEFLKQTHLNPKEQTRIYLQKSKAITKAFENLRV